MVSLLPELCRFIVTHNIDRPTLVSLLTASRVFQHEAERIIYRSIELKDVEIDAACTSLLATPRFLNLVKCLNLTCNWGKDQDRSLVMSFKPRLASLLKPLTNLVVLEIIEPGSMISRNDFGSPWRNCENLFRGSGFQLQRLRCQFILDNDFARFLERQPMICWMDWSPNSPPTSQLADDALHCLRTLRNTFISGELESLRAVVVGRPVSNISGILLSRMPLLQSLRSCIVPLKTLDFANFKADDLKALPDLFPQLEHLSWIRYTEGGIDRLVPVEPAAALYLSWERTLTSCFRKMPSYPKLSVTCDGCGSFRSPLGDLQPLCLQCSVDCPELAPRSDWWKSLRIHRTASRVVTFLVERVPLQRGARLKGVPGKNPRTVRS
jgi:hypothetical protein